jgi:hypothetical protein
MAIWHIYINPLLYIRVHVCSTVDGSILGSENMTTEKKHESAEKSLAFSI